MYKPALCFLLYIYIYLVMIALLRNENTLRQVGGHTVDQTRNQEGTVLDGALSSLISFLSLKDGKR